LSLKARTYYGKNQAKLAGFKNEQDFFCSLKRISLVWFLPPALMGHHQSYGNWYQQWTEQFANWLSAPPRKHCD
jgi:hypothetical protein